MIDEITAVEEAQWVHNANLLKDSNTRPGSPLRSPLRNNLLLDKYSFLIVDGMFQSII